MELENFSGITHGPTQISFFNNFRRQSFSWNYKSIAIDVF